ncbi:5-oxoprolinase subunit PxpB [Bacillus clarus]|uniref:5-oxoprolinase subunit PxpB n=1 Tax=Bacillus clarus TaxID=2338372 RepID=A0A090YT04_9BACI|nr:5-oxoprolinase subunit PxpB [Bacillus clarus]KFN01063.1 kinase A inhibitor [Bacillus clarus]RFT65548.1 5-oxoprolinase subunit PxpB [Bacillus clarus]
MKFSALGDQAVVVTFGESIQMDIYENVQQLFQSLKQNPFSGMIECVPSFTSLTVYYDLYTLWKRYERNIVPYDYICEYISKLYSSEKNELKKQFNHITIPVCYGGEYGPDLEEVASYHKLQAEDVIRIHSETTYFVYMLGFTPGFPYLGGLSKELETPRKQTPRLQIAPGSVGIGGSQTGIYPLETPGGWNIIGRTPISLFHPEAESPTYIQSGMYLRFTPITEKEYVTLEGDKK